MSTPKTHLDTSGALRYKIDMNAQDAPTDPPVRKSVSLPKSMWDEIAEYRFTQRITTEAEAVRRLLQLALRGAGKRAR